MQFPLESQNALNYFISNNGSNTIMSTQTTEATQEINISSGDNSLRLWLVCCHANQSQKEQDSSLSPQTCKQRSNLWDKGKHVSGWIPSSVATCLGWNHQSDSARPLLSYLPRNLTENHRSFSNQVTGGLWQGDQQAALSYSHLFCHQAAQIF